MAAITTANLRRAIRFRGDYRNSVRFPDVDVDRETQGAFGEFWELVADTNEGYWDTTATVQTVAGQAFVPLPADHWRLRGLDRIEGSCVVELEQVGISRRNRYGTVPGRPCAYRPTARGVELYPTPDAVYTLRITYTPSAPSLTKPAFVGASDATFVVTPASPSDLVSATVTTPTDIAPGDTMLIVIQGLLITPPTGFEQVLVLTSVATQRVILLRRVADGTEAATLTTITEGTCACGLLVYRRLGDATIVDSAIEDIDSQSYVCPSLSVTATSDLYLGIMSTTDGDGATFTPPVGAVERLDVTQTITSDQQLAAFDQAAGVIGATGTKTATASSSRVGIAAAVAIAVNPTFEFYNDWEEYVIDATCIRLAKASERDVSEWQASVDRHARRIKSAASGRQSQSPELLVLFDDDGVY